MKALKILLVFSLAFVLQGCPGDEDASTLLFYNYSGQRVYVKYDFGETVPPFSTPFFRLVQIDEIVDNNVYVENFGPDIKFYFFVVKESTVEEFGWEQIEEQQLVDKQYEFTLEELREMDFKLKYYGD
ncbi:MAG: hypothetical protein EOO50_13620 [Flavobacterium sp.]|uniref:hypothetical protein n=1 Tax=Flavobacterium sp. TaxID=239 RepID=UPI001216038F|nr:hypothetical protein [Flavobacterium sp.]RZJ65497.1 MAG: hypothetical protein EOO50_13620 [Flavobacterium sp.]